MSSITDKSPKMDKFLSGLSKEEKVKKINEELTRHDKAFTQLEADLSLVQHDYTKELLRTHISTVINNVIYLKGLLEELTTEIS